MTGTIAGAAADKKWLHAQRDFLLVV